MAIGNGTPELADKFVRDMAPTFEVYTDPTLSTYAAAGLNHNHWFSFRSLGNAVRAWRGGHRASGLKGDAKQQGGVIAADVTGRVLFFHADSVAGDNVDPAEVWMRSRNALAGTGRRASRRRTS